MTESKESVLTDDSLPNVNIIIMGKTGVGKSTLINSVFGKVLAKTGIGGAQTDTINSYTNETLPITIYDTVGIELDQIKRNKTVYDIKKLIENKLDPLKNNNPLDVIHCIWYCINTQGSRVESYETDVINELLSKYQIPLFVIFTQSYFPKKAEPLIEVINKRCQNNPPKTIALLAESETFDTDNGEKVCNAYGLKELVNSVLESISSAVETSFIAAQRIDLKLKHSKANTIIKEYGEKHKILINTSFVGFFIKINYCCSMVKDIAILYGIPLTVKDILSILGERPFKEVLSIITSFMFGIDINSSDVLLDDEKKLISGSAFLHIMGIICRDTAEDLYKTKTPEELSKVKENAELFKEYLEKHIQRENIKLLMDRNIKQKQFN